MGFGEFLLQLNNDKKMSLQNLKELKKSDLKGNHELIKLFDFFNTNKSKGSEEVLDKEELTSLFNTMQKSAQSSKGKDTSIFETAEAEDFISKTQTTEGKTLKELGVKASDVFDFLSKLIKPDCEPQNSFQHLHNTHLTEEQLAQEAVIRNLSNDTDMAITILESQNNGAVSDLYDKYKEWRDDDLSLSNVEEAVVLQQEGVYNLQKAKDGTLSKKEYFLQNREHLKTMMKRRLFRKDENTGLDFLDRNRGKMTKKEFEKLMEKYINYQIDMIDNLDSLKSVQRGLIFAISNAGLEQMLLNYKKDALKIYNNIEQKFTKKEMPKIPVEYDTTEPMTFEEVFKFERGQEYSKEKVIEYLKDDIAINYTPEELVADSVDIINNEHAEQELKKFDSKYKMAFGDDNAKDLVESMEQDNKAFMDTVDEITDGTQITGLGCTVVGTALLFTPAAAAGAGLITLGNTLSIGGLAADNVVGYTEALTRQNINPDEIEELNNSLLMDAGGFLVGAAAGKAGIKAFNKLIDIKLAEVFKTQMTQGNRMEALKQVFKNPEYLKNFMQAAGVKLSADFLISYAGDLAMSEAIGTDDDWESLLKANLIGLAAGTSGDIKDVAQIGIKGERYRTLKQKEESSGLTAKETEELATLRNDPDIKRAYLKETAQQNPNSKNTEEKKILERKTSSIKRDKKAQLPISELINLPEIQNLLGMEVEVTYTSGKKARLTIKEKLEKLSKQNPNLTKSINDVVKMAKKVKDEQRIQNKELVDIRNKFCSTKLNDQLYDIECTIGSVKDEKVLEFVTNELIDIKSNANKVKDVPERLKNVQLAIDAYNIAEGHYTYIGNKSSVQEYPEYRRYIDELNKRYNKDVATKMRQYPTFKEKYTFANVPDYYRLNGKINLLSEYRKESAELQKNIRFTRLKEFCAKNPDSEISTHLYKEFYLKQAGIPKKIQRMCLNISEKYNVKIFLPKECKKAEQAINYIEQELAAFSEAMEGSGDKLRHVIDIGVQKSDFLSGDAVGFIWGFDKNTVHLPSLDIEEINTTLRHELMHTFDTKFGVSMDDIGITEVAFPKEDINGNVTDVEWHKSSKYDDEFRNAGITDQELIDYAYSNSKEFVAVASEGDMSKYSENFKQLLISKGMPEWAFNLKSNLLNVY